MKYKYFSEWQNTIEREEYQEEEYYPRSLLNTIKILAVTTIYQ